MRDVMQGREPREASPSIPSQLSIDPKRDRIDVQPLLPGKTTGEFPAVDPRRTGRAYRKLILATREPGSRARHAGFDAISRLDLVTGAVDRYTYAPHVIPEEHVYVPDATRQDEDSGWIVGTSLDFHAAQTRLSIFDARSLADGPVAVATLPYVLPLGLHGKFVAA